MKSAVIAVVGLWALAVVGVRGQEILPSEEFSPAPQDAATGEEARTRAALQESLRALRALVYELERENARLKSENQSLAQRLDQVSQRLAAVTQTAAEIERERDELARALREQESYARELERKWADATNRLARLSEPAVNLVPADRRDLVAALEKRTQECLELRAQLEALRRGDVPSPTTGEVAAAVEDRIRALTRQFEDERKTLQTTLSVIEEQRAELERRCAELRRDNERLLKALRARDAKSAEPEAGPEADSPRRQ